MTRKVSRESSFQAQLPAGSQVTLLTHPATASPDLVSRVTNFIITNANVADRTVELWVVPAGGTPTDANAVLASTTIGANDILDYTGAILLDTPGDTLQAEASNATSLTITGVYEVVNQLTLP